MIRFYLVGLSVIMLAIGTILGKKDFYLEKKNYYFVLGYSLFGMYIYLSFFLAAYLHKACFEFI